jgi:flavin-binding protein dodecin
MSKKKGFSAEEVADLRGSFRKIINSAVNEAVDSAKKQIKNIVSEYSERRGVGERN